MRQAIRYKLTPQQADEIAQRFARFGGREDALAAYYRRRFRQEQLGIQNIAHATPGQVAAARAAGALGQSGQDSGLGGQLTVGAPGAPAGRLGVEPNPMQMGASAPLAGQQMAMAPSTPLAAPAADPVTGGVPAPGFGMGARTPLAASMSAYYPPSRRRRNSFG